MYHAGGIAPLEELGRQIEQSLVVTILASSEGKVKGDIFVYDGTNKKHVYHTVLLMSDGRDEYIVDPMAVDGCKILDRNQYIEGLVEMNQKDVVLIAGHYMNAMFNMPIAGINRYSILYERRDLDGQSYRDRL